MNESDLQNSKNCWKEINIVGNGLKWLDMSGNVKKWQEIVEKLVKITWKGLKISRNCPEISLNGWKCLKIAVNCLEIGKQLLKKIAKNCKKNTKMS